MKKHDFCESQTLLNQFFSSLFKELRVDNKHELSEGFIQTLSLLLDEQREDVRKYPMRMQMRLTEKIKNTTQLFSKSLEGMNKNDTTIEKEILYWKQKLELLGITEKINLSILDQVQGLFKATQKQDFIEMSHSFKALANHIESGETQNLAGILDELKKQLPTRHYDNITKNLNNSAPEKITSTLNAISDKLKNKDAEINLDDIVKFFEENLKNIFTPDKEEKVAKLKAEYNDIAQNSIRSSLMAHGIKPLT